MSGHGWVALNTHGVRARCGGPALCGICSIEAMLYTPEVSKTLGALALATKELERATRKFPWWPTDPMHALAILGEEFGELTKAMLQLVYEPEKSSRAMIEQEAIQVAAMTLRLLMNLEHYRYQPSHRRPE